MSAHDPSQSPRNLFFFFILGLLLLLLAGTVWLSFLTHKKLTRLQSTYTLTMQDNASTTAALQSEIKTLEGKVSDAKEKVAQYKKKYEEKEQLTDDLENQVQNITNTVSDIKDYTFTDPELLKKYSRISFLNENYRPKNLDIIPKKYDYNTSKTMFFNTNALPFLLDLMDAAKASGHPLRIISAYRSFDEQAALKGHYIVTYGKAFADQFSATQGYSEHQLGTTIDFTTPQLGSKFTSFDKSNAYDWLTQNASQYGFILSYPKNNDYYEYEPWHWRFVGIELATDIHNSGENFYELSQRKLDSYRGKIWEISPEIK